MCKAKISFDPREAEVKVTRRRYRVPYFSCLVIEDSRDAREVLKTLTQNESYIFWSMDQAKDKNSNQVLFGRANLPAEKVNSFPKIVKSLIDKEMIVRTGNNRYLINPSICLPVFERYEEVLARWKELIKQ